MVSQIRHQAPLESVPPGVAARPRSLTLNDPESKTATDVFTRFLDLFQLSDGGDGGRGISSPQRGYKRMTLLSTIHDLVQSKGLLLRWLFAHLEREHFGVAEDTEIDFSLALSRYKDFESWDLTRQQNLRTSLGSFADFLIYAFFLPMKALGATPILSPPTPAIEQWSTIPEVDRRASNLRPDCLRRDGHRCVVTGKFDAMTRFLRRKESGNDARDDDGNELSGPYEALQVSHIIPRSLVSQTDEAKEPNQVALRILDMFDPGISHLLEGPGIDRAYNAITLTATVHLFFGAFEIYFKSTDEKHFYQICAWGENDPIVDPPLPAWRKLRLDPDRTIDPPSPRLLEIHRAVGQILHLSAAGDHISDIISDLEDIRVIAEDGSSPLANYVSAQIGGWTQVPVLG